MSRSMYQRLPVVVLNVAVALALTACGEQPQVVVYEQGQYQGKTDARPWDGPEFKGDKTAWEAAIRNRARGQNEYSRIQ